MDAINHLMMKIEAQKMATAQVLAVVVQRLVQAGSLDGELLLEQLHSLQANVPGLGQETDDETRAIAKEVLGTLGVFIQSIDQAVALSGEPD